MKDVIYRLSTWEQGESEGIWGYGRGKSEKREGTSDVVPFQLKTLKKIK